MKQIRKIPALAVSLLCLFFVIWFSFSSPLTMIVRAEKAVIYVSDIKLWSDGKSEQDAKKYFDSIGYKFLNVDLNAGTDTGECVFLGYKTTDDPEDAITDIRMLPMDTGYQLYDYNQITDYLVSENQGTAKKMASTAATFADYYDEGSPKAIEAYKGLNLFNLGDEEKTGLGDYILENRDDLQTFFVKMIINSNASVIGSVVNLLSVGVTPYENDYDPQTKTFFTSSWAQRVHESLIWEQLDQGITADEEKSLDKAYNDNAKILFKELQSFATLYENAKIRYNEQAIKDKGIFDSYENAVNNMDDITEEDTDIIYISAYDTLAGYEATEGVNLAQWLLSIGTQTEETVDYRQLYPVLEALGDAQMDMIALTNFLSAVNNLGENEQAKDYEYALDNARAAIEGFNGDGTATISLWETAEGDMKDKYYAYTSEAVRKSSAENSIGRKTYLEKLDEDFQKAMGWIKLAVGIATTLVAFAEVIMKICAYCAWVSVAVSACALKILGFLSLGGLILSGIIVLVEIGYSIFCFFYELIHGIDKTLNHTEKPSYIFDSVDKADGPVTVRYTSALDNSGKIGDLNASKQYKWCILSYTKDKNVGSPLCLDDSNNVFRAIYGNSSNQNGYSSVKYFGERNVGNTNAYCEDDDLRGCYLHYRTLSSIAGAAPESEGEQETEEKTDTDGYIGNIIISTAKNVEEAKAKIVRHEGKYYTYDYNLSPEMGFATYIGYSITNDPSKAVTDIRVAPYAGNSDATTVIISGDIKYTRADIIGTYVSNSDEQTKPQADALYFTTDQNAGSPIPIDGLHFVTDFSKVEKGWEPVSLFCADYPYDFNTSFVTTDAQILDTFSGYKIFSTKKTKNVYMYFEPTEKYTGGEMYLSGFYFIGGYSLVSTPDYTNEKVLDFNTLKDKISAIPNTRIHSYINSPVIYGTFTSPGTGLIQEYLVYTYTYNPERAITDATLYQGVTYADIVPYNMTKPNSSDTNVGYTACSYIGQQLYDVREYKDNSVSQGAALFIHKGNTFIDSSAMNILPERAASVRDYGLITTPYGNINYGYKYSDYLPEGLFVSRHTPGLEPLKLSDVVLSGRDFTGVEEDGNIRIELKGEKALDGNPCQGYYHSIYEMKDPYTKKANNLSYDQFYRIQKNNPASITGSYSITTNLFMYLRGAKEAKPAYISSLSVGSLSRSQYKYSSPSAKSDELESIDAFIEYYSILSATSDCTGEVIMVNASLSDQKDAWYNRQINNKADRTPPENKAAAYIGVSRTSDPKKAITGVMLYQSDSFVTAAEMTVGGVTYKCKSTKSPIEMNGKNYFLYYTYNSGALPGKPIEDIKIDDIPLISGYATNLAYDDSRSNIFGNPDQANFIHLKYSKTADNFYNKLYIGKGDSKRNALCDLLSQGCTDFVDLDLNTGVKGSCIYLGYRTKEIDWAKINSKNTEAARKTAYEDQTKEAVYDIIVTKGKKYCPDGFVNTDDVFYYPVSDTDLNDGKGDVLYMYYTCPYYSNRYNTNNDRETLLPQNIYTGFYKKIGLARYDRVPYNTSLDGTWDAGKAVTAWEYIMYNDNLNHVDFNSGTVSYNSELKGADDIRVTMFGQRSDGSVKSGAEITGGFLTDTLNIGSVTFNYN